MRQEILEYMNARLDEVRAQNDVFDTCVSTVEDHIGKTLDSITQTSFGTTFTIENQEFNVTVALNESLYDGIVTTSIDYRDEPNLQTIRLATFTTTSNSTVQENYMNIPTAAIRLELISLFSDLYDALKTPINES